MKEISFDGQLLNVSIGIFGVVQDGYTKILNVFFLTISIYVRAFC